jgi:flavorubredoxin
MSTGRGGAHAGAMQTNVHEIADGVYRLSTCVPDVAPDGFTFNQFLIDADEPLLFHCGPRRLFATVSAAAAAVLPLDRLRWITFGHVEADECGSMNQWLAAAPRAEIAYGALGCQVSLNDIADRPPRPLVDGRRGHRPRRVARP